ncbi:MAG: hypothetical protein GY953_28405 [bacterium]|nr:hypothetical protein [bacterium]
MDGYRGARASNMADLVQALSRFSILVDSLSDVLESLDVNPVICGRTTCVAADTLVVAR